MAEKNNEPQSYGSQSEWVRGDVVQEVNPNSQPSDLEKRESDSSVSPEQLADNQQASGPAIEEGEPVQKVTAQDSGAKRDSYFKKRDYER